SSERHRLEQRHWKAFIDRWQSEYIHRGHQVIDAEAPIARGIHEDAFAFDAQRRSQRSELVSEGTAADEEETRLGFLLHDQLGGANEEDMALDARESAGGAD